MSGKAITNDIPDDTVAVAASGASGRHVSIEERRRLVADSLRVGNPGNNAKDLPARADPRHECQIELAVDDIRPYENNPRQAGNPKFAEIKESIRASGLRSPLTVTRRPGEDHFIVESGGNTRLAAIQQLWAETSEARFQKIVVLFRPWRSENHVLASHLIENELRGEMTFWDKANAIVSLKARLEAEVGRALSLRQLEDEIGQLGLSVSTATLGLHLFATERLRILGEAVSGFSGLDVKTIQPRLNHMKRLALARASLSEDDLYKAVFEPVFGQAADQYRKSTLFSAAELCLACEEALARYLGEPVEKVRVALEAPTRPPAVSTESFAAPAGASWPVQSEAITPTKVGDPAIPNSPDGTANREAVVAAPRAPAAAAPSANARTADPTSRLMEGIQDLAARAGIADLVHPSAAALIGYAVADLPTLAGGVAPPPTQRRAWLLLAVLSGQLDTLSETLSGSSTDDELPSYAVNEVGMLRWLINAQDDVANAFWHVLNLARTSHPWASAPARSIVPNPDREGA